MLLPIITYHNLAGRHCLGNRGSNYFWHWHSEAHTHKEQYRL